MPRHHLVANDGPSRHFALEPGPYAEPTHADRDRALNRRAYPVFLQPGWAETGPVGPQPGAQDDAAGPAAEPGFARFHGAMAAVELEQAPPAPDLHPAAHDARRTEAAPARAWWSRAAAWLGGLGFAVLAAGGIALVAAIQASGPLAPGTAGTDGVRRRDRAGARRPGRRPAPPVRGGACADPSARRPGSGRAGGRHRAVRWGTGDPRLDPREHAGDAWCRPAAAATYGRPLTQGEHRVGPVPRPVAKPRVVAKPMAPAPRQKPDEAAPAAPAVAFDLRAPATMGGPLQLVRRAPATAAAGPAEFRVQLAALRDEANAATVWHDYLTAFGPLVADLTRYDIPASARAGVFHLLQIGPLADLAQADAMCNQIKQRGHDCAVVQVRS